MFKESHLETRNFDFILLKAFTMSFGCMGMGQFPEPKGEVWKLEPALTIKNVAKVNHAESFFFFYLKKIPLKVGIKNNMHNC